jgi:hypothetical protein
MREQARIINEVDKKKSFFDKFYFGSANPIKYGIR